MAKLDVASLGKLGVLAGQDRPHPGPLPKQKTLKRFVSSGEGEKKTRSEGTKMMSKMAK